MITEGFLRLTRKCPDGAAVAALRDIDAVSHKSTGQRADELISVSLNIIISIYLSVRQLSQACFSYPYIYHCSLPQS